MNILLALTSILIFAFSLLPSQLHAAANTYYVTQKGNGARSGISLGNAWSISDFNSSANWSATDNFAKIDPGDTVYFSGTITSEIAPGGSGSASGYVTLDGYKAGNCDALSEYCPGQAVISRTQSSVAYGFALWDSSYGYYNGRDYLIIQDFEIKEVTHAIYGAEGNDHIIIRRNFIHDVRDFGLVFTTGGGGYDHGHSYITVGGARGDGNVVKDAGSGTAGGDVNIGHSHDIIISYNHLYATKDNGNSGDRGIDGVVLNHDVNKVLIEYNSIHSHNDSYGGDAKGEDGIDIKDDGRTGGCYDIIIRFNNIYDHQYQATVNLQTVTHKTYVYGNRLSDSNWGGVYIYEGGNRIGGAPPVNNIYIMSNLIFDQRDAGSRVVSTEYGQEAHHIYYFNNTFAENGIDNHGSSFTHITADINSDSVAIKNNIFYKSRPGYPTLQERQVHLYRGITEESNFDYNLYWWPNKSSQINIGLKRANAIGGIAFVGAETNGSEGNPGLADIANNNYKIASNESAVVGAGVDLGSGVIANVIIQGVVYPVYWDVALGPSTDWSGIIPEVEVLRRDAVGWDIGAYAYAKGHFAQPSIIPPSRLRIITQ